MNTLIFGITVSRWLTIIGGLGALFGEASGYFELINPKVAHTLAVVGTFLAMVNERIHGGVSKQG